MLLRLWLTCVLVLASASAWAQPVVTRTPVAVDQAQATVTAGSAKVGQLAGQRAKIAERYRDETATVDRLKQERASWRRDRELRASLADFGDTANQLAALDQQLAAAQRALTAARTALAVAIDAELAVGTASPRAQQLLRLRQQLDALRPPAPKKIIVPDAEIDPLADPEELEQQVQAIAETEKQLATQVASLDAEASELAHVADLRKHHDRANEMMLRDDDQPHRNAQQSASTKDTTQSAATPAPGAGGGGGGGGATGGDNFAGGDHTSSFESEATFVLGEVIDRSTIESLTSASRSGDPGRRADAAKQARDAVAARLESLRRKRQQIELRAKQLRGKR